MEYNKNKWFSIMKKTIIRKALLLIMLSAAYLCSSCYFHPAQKAPVDQANSLGNHVFTLDFENDNCSMADVETYFFTTFPHNDPTLGKVIYDRKQWSNQNMIQLKKGDGLYLYIKQRDDNAHFDSFRLTSKPYYNLNENTKKLLFVFKGKFPSAKGVWPAWWLNGSEQDAWIYKNSKTIQTDADLDKYSGTGEFHNTPSPVNSTDWPGAGEIDIIENINGEDIIHNTIHTCPNMCDSEWNSDGEIINCANATPEDPNSGCSGKPYKISAPEGTFACLWENNSLKFYYWPPQMNVRNAGGPLSDKPVPGQWTGDVLKNEVRLLETDSKCNEKTHQKWQCNNCAASNSCSFKNMKMIFNITLCGIWAGEKFDATENSQMNCQDYIFGEGKEKIDDLFYKIEYVSVQILK